MDLFQVYEGVMKMMKHRKYDVSSMAQNEDEMDQIITQSRESKDEFYTILDPKGKRLDRRIALSTVLQKALPTGETEDAIIIFHRVSEQQVNVDTIRNITELVSYYYGDNPNRVIILVSATPLSNDSISEFEALNTPTSLAQFFLDDELVYSLVDSIYVPKLIELTEEKKLDWLDENNIKVGQLPRRSTQDAQIKYEGLRAGTVVRFIRESLLEGLLVPRERFYVLIV